MCKLLEIAKEKTGLSYYAIAKAINVSDQVMNKWKNDKSKPNGLHTLKLAEMAQLSTSEARHIVEGGFITLSLLKVTALSSIALLATIILRQVCILCKIALIKKRQLRLPLVIVKELFKPFFCALIKSA